MVHFSGRNFDGTDGNHDDVPDGLRGTQLIKRFSGSSDWEAFSSPAFQSLELFSIAARAVNNFFFPIDVSVFHKDFTIADNGINA